jgi:choline dehydrogenase-like flavoprotein
MFFLLNKKFNIEKSSDNIVAGEGASGCALTNKLLNANQSVTLIEAGYSHHNILLDAPAIMLGLHCTEFLIQS